MHVKVSVLKPLLMFVHRTLDREALLTTSVEDSLLKHIFDYRSKDDPVIVGYIVTTSSGLSWESVWLGA
jgi:hypothetical protein